MLNYDEILEYCLDSKKILTPTRALILSTLSKYENPKSAYDLRDDINSDKENNLNISTIYRVLEFWIDLRVVHKISSLNKFFLCMRPKEKHTHMLNFCTSCEKVFESCSKTMGLNLNKSTSNLDLSLDNKYSIEIPVICSSCS